MYGMFVCCTEIRTSEIYSGYFSGGGGGGDISWFCGWVVNHGIFTHEYLVSRPSVTNHTY